MTKTDKELRDEFTKRWKDLEKTLRRVSVYQSYTAPLRLVVKFLRATGPMEHEDRWKPLTIYQEIQATLLQPSTDYALTQGEVNEFKKYADNLKEKLQTLLDNLKDLETQKS